LPDVSKLMEYRYGPGSVVKFGKPIPYLVTAIKKGDQSSDPAVREQFYTKANNLIKSQVPAVIIAHGGSGAAYKANVQNAVAAPLEEQFAFMKSATDTLTFMQNAEPLSLYCGDDTDGETPRACNQVKESLY